jgi:4,5-DOPA dioxygenase extradiol
MTSSPAGIVAMADHPDFHQAVPTPEHFIPLLYLAGLADAAHSNTAVLTDGYTYGALSMTAYTLDAPQAREAAAHPVAARLPDPHVVPADDTNT